MLNFITFLYCYVVATLVLIFVLLFGQNPAFAGGPAGHQPILLAMQPNPPPPVAALPPHPPPQALPCHSPTGC